RGLGMAQGPGIGQGRGNGLAHGSGKAPGVGHGRGNGPGFAPGGGKAPGMAHGRGNGAARGGFAFGHASVRSPGHNAFQREAPARKTFRTKTQMRTTEVLPATATRSTLWRKIRRLTLRTQIRLCRLM